MKLEENFSVSGFNTLRLKLKASMFAFFLSLGLGSRAEDARLPPLGSLEKSAEEEDGSQSDLDAGLQSCSTV